MLDSLIAELRDREHQFTIYRSGTQPEIEAWLADHGVAVESRSLPPGGPEPYLEIETAGEVVGIIGIDAIEGLVEPPIRRPGDRDGISEGYRVLFDVLEQTVVSGMHRRELLAVSREIEDRAYRVGEGTLRVSLQTLSTFRSQIDLYRTLAAETTLDIHIYGRDDWTPPTTTGVSYHTEEAERFEPYWALAYDGGPTDSQACGLVAREHSNGYTGFWMNDPALVEEVVTALTAGGAGSREADAGF
ncbi:DICT sensory domain-containing protein [Halobellus ordinarius]|uniref:DICT sensory domain-containing protein n=1 Tax=Halobellus ordinarius TaxID=3075120 RepID=UPI0028802402|nr:DICT sensory domain-containing protein [Halobellus sp. ZY16]